MRGDLKASTISVAYEHRSLELTSGTKSTLSKLFFISIFPNLPQNGTKENVPRNFSSHMQNFALFQVVSDPIKCGVFESFFHKPTRGEFIPKACGFGTIPEQVIKFLG